MVKNQDIKTFKPVFDSQYQKNHKTQQTFLLIERLQLVYNIFNINKPFLDMKLLKQVQNSFSTF